MYTQTQTSVNICGMNSLGPWRGQLPSLPLSPLPEYRKTQAHNCLGREENGWARFLTCPARYTPSQGPAPTGQAELSQLLPLSLDYSRVPTGSQASIVSRPAGLQKAAGRLRVLPEGVGGAKLPRRAPVFTQQSWELVRKPRLPSGEDKPTGEGNFNRLPGRRAESTK